MDVGHLKLIFIAAGHRTKAAGRIDAFRKSLDNTSRRE